MSEKEKEPIFYMSKSAICTFAGAIAFCVALRSFFKPLWGRQKTE